MGATGWAGCKAGGAQSSVDVDRPSPAHDVRALSLHRPNKRGVCTAVSDSCSCHHRRTRPSPPSQALSSAFTSWLHDRPAARAHQLHPTDPARSLCTTASPKRKTVQTAMLPPLELCASVARHDTDSAWYGGKTSWTTRALGRRSRKVRFPYDPSIHCAHLGLYPPLFSQYAASTTSHGSLTSLRRTSRVTLTPIRMRATTTVHVAGVITTTTMGIMVIAHMTPPLDMPRVGESFTS